MDLNEFANEAGEWDLQEEELKPFLVSFDLQKSSLCVLLAYDSENNCGNVLPCFVLRFRVGFLVLTGAFRAAF